jgi:phage terminase small subunit
MKDKSGLTKKQKRFVDAVVETGNLTEAAAIAYDVNNRNTAKSLGSENMAKPDIIKYFQSIAPEASDRLKELMWQNDNLAVALGASKDILDRAGYKPVDKAEVNNPDGNLKTIVINKSGNNLDVIE